jgi:hypothetical protein
LAAHLEHQQSSASPTLEYHHHHHAAPTAANGQKSETGDDAVRELHEDSKHMSASSTATISTTKQPAVSAPRGRGAKNVVSIQPNAMAKSVDGAISSAPSGINKQSFPVMQTARARSLERSDSNIVSSEDKKPTALDTEDTVVTGIGEAQSTEAGAKKERRSISRFPVATLPRGALPKDELAFRRKRDAVYSQRKRERKRIEVEELQKQELLLSAWNDVLRSEGDRLEELLRTAQEEKKRRRGVGGGGGGSGDWPIYEC